MAEVRSPVTSEGRVALYLQDKHPIRDGHGVRRSYAESAGFEAVWQAESRLVREATVPMAAFAAVTDRIKVGSGVVNNWTRNAGLLAATFSTLDDLAPGRIILGIGAWWDPLAAKVGIHRDHPLQAMREIVEVVRGAAARWRRVTYRRRVRAPRRRRDRLRARRPVAEGRPDLHRRHRHEDDGAGRRDRRRRGAQLPRRARATTARRMAALAEGARAAGRTRRRHRPAAARRLLARRRPRSRPSTAARELVTQYLGQQPHIMKASGVDRVAARGDRRGPDLAGDPRADRAARCSWCPTRSCS